MKILITGNQGYIGPILEETLKEFGHQVIGLDTNYFSECSFFPRPFLDKQIFRDIRQVTEQDLEGVEGIVHLTALSNDSMGQLDPALTHQINTVGTKRLAELAAKCGVSRFVYSSSCSIYGIAEKDALTETDPLSPQTAYAQSKADCEKLLTELANENFHPVFMRNATAFGVSPLMSFDLVLNNFVGWACTTGKIRIMSDGSPWRPLVHIRDIAQAMAHALVAPSEKIHCEALNVGKVENNIQVKTLADIVLKTCPGSTVEYTGEHGSDTRTYNVSFEKIGKVLPSFTPQWDIERGVKEVYDACKKNNLKLEDFQGPRFVRLKRLAELQSQQKLNKDLHWKFK